MADTDPALRSPLPSGGQPSEVAPGDSETMLEVASITHMYASRFRKIMQAAQSNGPCFGELWTTLPDPGMPDEEASTRLVVVLDQPDADDAVMVAPLSLDVRYRGPADLLIGAEEGPLQFEVMAEVWNAMPALRQQLGRSLGSLSQPSQELIALLYQEELGSEIDRSRLLSRVGPSILSDDDPRVVFQEEETAVCEYLKRPYLHRLGAYAKESAPVLGLETFGELVQEREADFAPHLPKASLEWLRQSGEPLEGLVVRDPKGRMQALAALGRSAKLVGDDMLRNFIDAATRALNDLMKPSGARRAEGWTRRQRGKQGSPRDE